MTRSPALPLVALAATAVAMTAAAASADPAELTDWLRRAQFWFLEAQGVALAVTTAWCLPAVLSRIGVTRATLMAMMAVSAAALWLVVGVAPRTNRIYYDEHIYQGVGQNLSDTRLAQMCHDGIVEYGVLQCARGEYNKDPNGYPYLLSVGYRLFGVSELVAHRLNALCAVAAVWAAFLAGALLFGRSDAGVYAAMVLALVPQQVVWSHTAAVEPSAALMAAVAVAAAVAHARLQTTRTLFWMASAIVFAVQFRMEAALVVPLAGLALLVLAPRELPRARLWWAAVGGLLLSAAHVAHAFAVRHENWGSAGALLSLDYAWPNLAANGSFYVTDARFPAGFSLLAAVGLLWRPTRAALVPAAFFAAFFVTYLCFYAGSYDFGADVRFSLLTFPPLAVLAGRGLAMVLPAPAGWRQMAVAALVLGVQFLWHAPQVRAVGDEGWAARADVAFAHRTIPTLPANAIVLTHNPSIFHLNGVNAAQMGYAQSDRAWVSGFLPSRHAGGVYLHWNAWCGYEDPSQRELCEATLAGFDSTLAAEYRERDFRYAFYKVRIQGTAPRVAP